MGRLLGVRTGLLGIGATLFSTVAAAQEPAAALVDDKGDSAWLLTSTILILLMIVPGLALFYGGLVRAKNMLSMLSQVFGITALAVLVWVCWGYGLAFGAGTPWFGGTEKFFLHGIGPDSIAATYSKGVGVPEFAYVAFQMTFSAITAALIVGGLAERVKFSAIMLFSLLWLTIVYAPVAHMVWASDGYIFGLGALDFAGGTVVHINAGIAGLVGVYFVGSRIGFQREATPPHSLTLCAVGAGLLWVGWFGFNAGSALEANGIASLAMINTFVAPAAGLLAWMAAERIVSGKPSLLGGATGAVAGLVGITPAAGLAGPMGAILLGIATSLVCYGFVASIKNRLGLDDTLDVFGVHGLGGIVGSIGTAFVASPHFGGIGPAPYSIGHQLVVQLTAVAIVIAWSAIGSAICFAIVKAAIGLRHDPDAEREGLDLADHGERAYSV